MNILNKIKINLLRLYENFKTSFLNLNSTSINLILHTCALTFTYSLYRIKLIISDTTSASIIIDIIIKPINLKSARNTSEIIYPTIHDSTHNPIRPETLKHFGKKIIADVTNVVIIQIHLYFSLG